MPAQSPKQRLPTTRWSLVKRAASDLNGSDMQELLLNYLPGLRLHLIYARDVPAQNVDDILQGFMISKVLRENWLQQAQSTRGRFRNFLLTSLDRFVLSEQRKARAGKRAPTYITHLDGSDEQERLIQGGGTLDVTASLDMAWIRVCIDEALVRTRRTCVEAGRDTYWILFQDRIINPVLNGTPPQPYAEFVATMGFKSPIQASNAITTVKRMFVRFFRDVISEHVRPGANIDREIGELWKILAAFDRDKSGYA